MALLPAVHAVIVVPSPATIPAPVICSDAMQFVREHPALRSNPLPLLRSARQRWSIVFGPHTNPR